MLEELEYETLLHNKYTPDIKTAVIVPILINDDKIHPEIAQNMQKEDEKSPKTEVINQSDVNYEVRDITPRSIFRRK